MIIFPIQGIYMRDIILSTQYSIDSMGAVDMMVWLDKEQLADIFDKRPKLRELIEMNLTDGVKFSAWKLDDGKAGKSPLMLIVKFDYGHLGKEYRLYCSQTGKNGAAYSWSLPDTMPDVKITKVVKGGRPTKYGEEERKKALSLRADGVSIRMIADMLGCSTYTVQRLLKA